MALPSLAIAKATLAAGFIRPDPTTVPRDEISKFHDYLDSALAQCSPTNIQRCKAWLVKNTVSSKTRTTAIGKYLVALTLSFGEQQSAPRKGSSSRRKQLHILYLLNDLFHGLKYHGYDGSGYSMFAESLQPHLTQLLTSAAGYDSKIYRRQWKRIEELLDEWDKHRYLERPYIQQLREAVARAELGGASPETNHPNGTDGEPKSTKPRRDAPYIMPSTHGDTSAPYYELPAGNMIPHIIPNSSIPINPQRMKAVRFNPGFANEKLATAVQTFLKEADIIYEQADLEDEGISMEMDEIGQTIVRDKSTGEIVSGETYYGWSKEFCEKMKKNEIGFAGLRDRSDSRGRSPSPHKRMRYASSYSSQSRSHSPSRSRSPPPKIHRSNHYSRPPSRDRSRSPPHFNRFGSHSRSPPPGSPPPRPAYQPAQPPIPPSPQQNFQHHSPVPPPPPPIHQPPFPFGMPPLGPDGLPLPPPRPPNWAGPWPPLPPGHSPGPGAGMQSVPPPPPPGPPPMQMQQGWNSQGRGGGYGQGYQGQGGYGGGYGGRGGGPGYGERRGRGRGGRGWR